MATLTVISAHNFLPGETQHFRGENAQRQPTPLINYLITIKNRIQLKDKKKSSAQPEPDSRGRKQEETPLICSHCSAAITTRRQAAGVNGRHEHAFFNPAGIAFEIRCFRKAPGCQAQGKPTTEFSWFNGYSWQFAHCRNCLTQLGWFFQSDQNKKSFFSLMVTKVI